MGLAWTLLTLGPLIVASYLVARHGLRQTPGLPRALAAVVVGWSWLTVGVEALGVLGHLTREALAGWSAAGLVVGLVCRVLGRREPEPLPKPAAPVAPWSWEEAVASGLTLWAIVYLGAISLFYAVKVVSDGPIYHLYFAARWWKAHRLELIPIPFGESAAPYFPAVGDLWYTWLMVSWGGDQLAKVGQLPFLAVAGLTAYALARRLGAARGDAVVATAWFVTATPFFIFSMEANVDTILVAGYLLAVYFFTRHFLGDGGLVPLALGGLAAGAALGTKATGIVFVPALLAVASVSAVVRGNGPRGKVAGLLVVWLAPLVVDGYWYVRNFRLTGNPLYPLHLTAFGRVWLAGWYGSEVMKRSRFYIEVDDWRSLVDQANAVFDPRMMPFWLAAVAGAWCWGRRASSTSREDAATWAISALAVGNIALFWLAIPYRTQQRFMFHAIGLAAVPLARTFARARWLRVIGFLILAVHMLTRQTWPLPNRTPPWDLTTTVPNDVLPILSPPSTILRLADVFSSHLQFTQFAFWLAIGLGALATAWAVGRAVVAPSWKRVATAWAVSLVFLAGSAGVYYPWGLDERLRFIPGFREYFRGWLEVDHRAGPNGVRIAYAGNDLPYYLMGVGLRNDVRYVNIDAHRDWRMHDYHREASKSAPATWDLPRPGWDRIHPDYDAWLANLRAEGIRLLVVTRVNIDEGPHNIADAYGFPIENVWAVAHPEVFEPLHGEAENDRDFRLYRVRPENPARAIRGKAQ